MNVLEVLEENNITFSLEYYGINDLATGWEIKSIVEHMSLFRDIFLTEETLIQMNYEKYLLYLLSKKICCMDELIPALIDEEVKEIISELITYSTKFLQSISKGDLIKYINSDFKKIFAEEANIDVKHITLDLIVQFSGGISDEVYSYLAENYGYLLIDKYSDFEKIFEVKPWLFEKTIPNASYSEVMMYRYDTVLNVYAHIKNKKNSTLTSMVDARIDVLYEDLSLLSQKLDDESIMREEHKIRLFALFLEKIKHRRAPEFAIFNESVEKKLTDYLNRKGQVFSYEIPVGDILAKWNEQKHWEIKLLSLTHDIIVNNRVEVHSRLDKHIEAKSSFIDLVSSNLASDSYFTHSHQQNLNIIASVGAGTMMGILANDEIIQDYFNMVRRALQFIGNKIQLEENSLLFDYDMMVNMILTIKANSSSGEAVLTPLCYSASMFMCGYSEKLLRKVYEYEARGKQYFASDRATLGQLLCEANSYIVNIFGVDHIRNLMFYLGTVGDKQIGNNIRNSLAHLTGNIEKQLTIGFVAQTMWLFTDIVDSIFGYYLLEHLEGGIGDDQL